MVDQLMFAQENWERIHAVEHSFGRLGKPLSQPGRVLIGEGRLMKQCRRGPKQKVFFLFNDVLVYGSIILRGFWHKNQQIIHLEDIQLEDLEDDVRVRNQWLIHTPHKSFHVAAASYEEKQAWIEHIEECQSKLLQNGGHRSKSTFPITWIPSQASAVCRRCSDKFTMTQRRHHCRKCGFVVCSVCSKKRAMIRHIHPTKRLRICCLFHMSLLRTDADIQEKTNLRDSSTVKEGSEEYEVEVSSEEEEAEVQMEVLLDPLCLPQK
ncbi:LOW QUALITY PROTEIN: pleckstrin homology domain-containing family F member 2-like [Seriola lalandi dorsalis]|uniref:LOW QUALITY PROTEIN: pleckstrin homology domain-containing family F member 2-like n=2 Tax=Seriola lalandi dorsalis TaxID=1841481 RepID=UPI000C6F7B6C|nr:LOW QUALITY PROTEIN: pleckstrin homology domain-containing family F member 2-like [Seriola lalandi dorsalis]XP_056243656.1 LOW QUALITY PROTEIN: pleckstrin homology domain-containing family F member 2-like [Seriola aureovittata]